MPTDVTVSPPSLSTAEQRLLDLIVDFEISQGNVTPLDHLVLQGPPELEAQVSATAASLMSTGLIGPATHTNGRPAFHVTTRGILLSQHAEIVSKIAEAVLAFIKHRLSRDGINFKTFSLSDLRGHGEPLASASALLVLTVVDVFRLSAGGTLAPTNSESWIWHAPHDAVSLRHHSSALDLCQRAEQLTPPPPKSLPVQPAFARIEVVQSDLRSISNCDLIVLPCSTAGTMKPWVERLARHLRIPAPSSTIAFGAISPIHTRNKTSYTFAASVDNDRSDASTIEELARTIGAITKKRELRSIAVPLLGAGQDDAGRDRISPRASYEAMARGFLSSAHPKARLIICIPEKDRLLEVLSAAPFSREEARAQPSDGAGRPRQEVPPPHQEPPATAVPNWSSFGAGVRLRREAQGTELRLDLEHYVQALARVLAEATGELCFALFGAWGRGKTTLARRLQRLLQEGMSGIRYNVVWFNAWKYRSAPETWAHLYEQLAAAAKDDGALASSARTIRTNILQRGIGVVTVSLFALSVATLPLSTKIDIAYRAGAILVGALGVFASFWTAFAANRTAHVIHRVWRHYGAIPSHRDKLGLQAAIGSDLCALLQGWIPTPGEGATRLSTERVDGNSSVRSPWPSPIQYFALALSIFSMSVSLWIGLGKATQPSGGLQWIGGLGWLIGWAGVAILVWKAGRRTNRILLVVDDLDRCRREQILEIIESIKLLVEEPACSARLQVVALVDDDVLVQAIEERFSHLIPSGASIERRHRVIREHIEKLFVGHLRLGALSPKDISDLISAFSSSPVSKTQAGAEKSSANAADGKTQFEEVVALPVPVEATASAAEASVLESRNTESTQGASPVDAVTPLPRSSGGAVELTSDETRVLTSRCETLLDGEDGARVGPRTVRSLMFRYKLARELLRTFDHAIPVDQIVDRLMLHYTPTPNANARAFGLRSASGNDKTTTALAIVDQVSFFG